MIRAMSTELFLNFLGIRMDSRKAEGMRFTINLVTPDNGEKFIVEMENATLTNITGFLAGKPDLTLTINRSDLELTMMGAKTLEAQIADGTAKVEGDAGILKQLASTMVDFDPRFEIMPGTKARTAAVARPIPTRPYPDGPSRNNSSDAARSDRIRTCATSGSNQKPKAPRWAKLVRLPPVREFFGVD